LVMIGPMEVISWFNLAMIILHAVK
jgi:hypothetical protein